MSSLFLSLAFISLIVAPALLALLTPSAGEESEVRNEAWQPQSASPKRAINTPTIFPA